jgi:serine/threonine protein kinase
MVSHMIASTFDEHKINHLELKIFTAKYYLGKTFSSGKFNAVALGRNKLSFKKVIIKAIYNPHMQKLREANLLKKLQHVYGVITYYDHYYVKNTITLLVMEYFGHMSLHAFLEMNGSISEDLSYKIFKQLLLTVKMCYQSNILHRKLRASNILINIHTFEIKVINFNSACQFDNDQKFTSQLSYKNAPPEYFKFKKYSAEGLYVWSLGLLLYNMLFGKPPFDYPCDTVNSPVNIPETKVISLDVKLFLKWLLKKDESDRITLNEMSFHPWITKKWI